MLINKKEHIRKAIEYSNYFKNLCKKDDQLIDHLNELSNPILSEDYFNSYANWQDLDESSLKFHLRKLRQLVMSHIIVQDINHIASLNDVTKTISLFADFSINLAVNFAQNHYQQLYGQPISKEDSSIQSLTIVGMGKLGGYELNVSSDIDLIFCYPQSGETDGQKTTSNQEFFTKVGKKVISLLNDTTEEGQVFRVDMRLRPYGDSGPLVVSEAALEQYLITQGREWERYAWIKGRVITPEKNDITSLVRPFVYRKYLDFNAYESMRNLHQQIKQEVPPSEKQTNIKLGVGGIREAEFIAQIFQLIWGGKNKSLQLKGTQETYEVLAQLGYLTKIDKDYLLESYRFLRNIEHRLQYIDDQQTQILPTNTEDQEKIAHNMGFQNYEAFLEKLTSYREHVKDTFDHILELPEQPTTKHELANIWLSCHIEQSTQEYLEKLGFSGTQTQLKLQSLKQGHKYKNLSSHSQNLFDKLIPILIEASGKSTHPDLVLSRFLDFLETISRRSSYLAFLCEYPETLKSLANIFGASAWLSTYLMRHPMLLDELLNSHIMSAPNWSDLAIELDQTLSEYADDDAESKMDALRHFQHAQTFRLAVQDLSGIWSVENLSDQLSFLADTIINSAFKHVWLGLKNKHIPEPKVAIIGYGKLGGKEMSYASDLDLVYIFEDTNPNAIETYSRFIRRLNTWLSSNTTAGNLYTIDLRLRPNGDAGLLICSFDAFCDYQKTKAWVWEHQSLTRARFICGHAKINEQFENLRNNILTTPKQIDFVRNEILTMRQRIEESHPPHLEDVKYARGGIIDIEFLVQYLILIYANQYPDLTLNSGNIALLATTARHNLIDTETAEKCRIAYRLYRQTQHNVNLYDTNKITDPEMFLPHYQIVKDLWKEMFNQSI